MRWKRFAATFAIPIMNESEFEQELRRLVPAPPTEALEARIATELQSVAPPARAGVPTAGKIERSPAAATRFSWRGFLPSLGWAAAGAAAAVAMLVSLRERPETTPSRPAPVVQTEAAPNADVDLFEPVESDSEVIASEEPQIYFDAEMGPAQIVRTASLERYTWSNPATGARIEVEMPREDVLLLPIAYQ